MWLTDEMMGQLFSWAIVLVGGVLVAAVILLVTGMCVMATNDMLGLDLGRRVREWLDRTD